MCDLGCDVSIYCVRSCDMGKINVYDEIVIENQKKSINFKEIFTLISIEKMILAMMDFTVC